MNLYGHWAISWRELLMANLKYYSPIYRPFGGVFYRSLFQVFGFDPLPFRLACYAIMFANLGLAYLNAKALSGRREAGALAALFCCYHVGFTDFYYSTGTVYDLLCFSFYFLALYLYGRGAGVWTAAAVVALYVFALNSKEMAVTLPAVLICYEAIYRRNRRAIPLIVLLAALTLPYVQGKLSAESPFVNVGDYQPHVSLAQYLKVYGIYLDRIFYLSPGYFAPMREIGLWVAMAGLAAKFRSKPLLFSTCFVLVSVLPVVFINPRGTIFVLYIPMFGWALYLAVLLVMAKDRMLGARPAWAVALFAVVAGVLVIAHGRKVTPPHVQPEIRAAYEQLRDLHAPIKPGGRILFLDDPFPKEQWHPVFISRLLYRDRELQVHRVKTMETRPDAASYDLVVDWVDGRYIRRASSSAP